MSWNYDRTLQHLDKLVAPGVLGTYRSFEVTELVRLPDRKAAHQACSNILTVIVADPRDPESGGKTPLAPKPLELKGLKWKVGLARYRISAARLREAIDTYQRSQRWQPGDDVIGVDPLSPLPPQFIVPDSFDHNPWNSVLKNNFWNGSHVLELFDGDKRTLSALVKDPLAQSALTALIRPFVPWGLDALSDRLGNIIIQLPVTALATDVRGSAQNEYKMRVAWDSSAVARPVRVTAEVYTDGILEAIDSSVIVEGEVALALHNRQGGARHTIWDDKHSVLLGASSDVHFLKKFVTSISSIDERDIRVFQQKENDGSYTPQSVGLKRPSKPSVFGDTSDDPRVAWRSKRILRKTLAKLEQSKEFVQYGGPSGAGRQQALDDIRTLMDRHGRTGTWLWDPYLSGKDLLDTLFFNPYYDADLRGLTASSEPPKCKNCAGGDAEEADDVDTHHDTDAAPEADCEDPAADVYKSKRAKLTKRRAFIARQAADLDACKGDTMGLKLEFRSREGGAGWAFHDRFIIFPGDEGKTLAWSLGTSVNSLGQEHHILQRVPDGELIRRAFLELWNALSGPNNLIWKTP